MSQHFIPLSTKPTNVFPNKVQQDIESEQPEEQTIVQEYLMVYTNKAVQTWSKKRNKKCNQ
jgi:hypothetical protein